MRIIHFIALFLFTVLPYSCTDDGNDHPVDIEKASIAFKTIKKRDPDLKMYLENVVTSKKTFLKDLGINPETNSVFGDIYSTERTANVREFVEKCGKKLRNIGAINQAPIFFVYRSVAAGGVARKLSLFAAKPLLIKAKSIDPEIILKDDLLKRLSGLLPTNTLLSKSKTPGTVTGIDSRYRILKEEGIDKFILYYNSSRELKWFKSSETPSEEWFECRFAGNKYENPYIADWDLVSIGVKKYVFKNWNGDRSSMNVLNAGNLGIVPFWMKEVLDNIEHFAENATQHGSESLYCGNDIQSESFFIVTLSGGSNPDVKSDTIDNFQDFSKKMQEMSGDYFIYKFPEFDGKPKHLDLPDNIEKLNQHIQNDVFPPSSRAALP